MIEKLLKNLQEKEVERMLIAKEIELWKDKVSDFLSSVSDLETSRSIFQKASQLTQERLSFHVGGVVSNALKAVFDEDPYEFKVDFVTRRNVTECDLLFTKNDNNFPPLDSCGYGAADIASLALRVAFWKLDGKANNILILDEPTRNLSLDKQDLASLMIKRLSEMLKLQFIIVTHNETLAQSADKVFKVTKNESSLVEVL